MNAPALPRFRYRDLYFRLIISLIGAHYVVMYGMEQTTLQAMFHPGYHIALWSSFLIALILISSVLFVTSQLDKKYDWIIHPYQRIVWQLALGLALPSLMAFDMAATYFYLHGIGIDQTLYQRIDFPIVVKLLIGLNVYYLLNFLIRYIRTKPPRMFLPGGHNAQLHDICYIVYKNPHSVLHLFSSEQKHLNATMEECMDGLTKDEFFKISRDFIVNRKAITAVMPYTNRRLQLTLEPPFSEPVIVSRTQITDFDQWHRSKE